jgi:hypothetical protein
VPAYIKLGRERVYLDADALASGDLRLEPGACGEQCDSCGEDILETGVVRKVSGDLYVVCSEEEDGCGTRHAITQEEET